MRAAPSAVVWSPRLICVWTLNALSFLPVHQISTLTKEPLDCACARPRLSKKASILPPAPFVRTPQACRQQIDATKAPRHHNGRTRSQQRPPCGGLDEDAHSDDTESIGCTEGLGKRRRRPDEALAHLAPKCCSISSTNGEGRPSV